MRYLFIFLVGFCTLSHSVRAQYPNPDKSKNYVRITRPRIKVAHESAFQQLKEHYQHRNKEEVIQYQDGLGRPLERVDWKSAPNGWDLIHFHEYDKLGREGKSYLPYAGWTNGSFFPVSQAKQQQGEFYNPNSYFNSYSRDHATTNDPSTEFQFEASPLNRILEQGAPGEAWQPEELSSGFQSINEHTVVQSYLSNDAPLKGLVFSENTSQTLLYDFPPGTLFLTKTQNENGYWQEIYTDKLNRRVMTRKQVNGTEYASTVFAYDALGRIKYIVQPEGWRQLLDTLNQGASISYLETASNILENYTFQYRYDKRGRVVEKKIPGSDWIFVVYDIRDRIILSQDGNQRNFQNAEWTFTVYDALDRPVMTGIYESTGTRKSLQDFMNNSNLPLFVEDSATAFTDKSGQLIKGYTNKAFPIVLANEVTIHSVAYYDNYDFDRDGNSDMSPNDLTDSRLPNLMNEVSERVRGKVTGVRVRILEPEPDMPEWLWTISWYDKHSRELITWSENHLSKDRDLFTGWLKTWDRKQYTYNFVGERVEEYHLHIRNGLDPSDMDNTLMWRKFRYNHRGLLLNTSECLKRGSDNLSSPRMVSAVSYNQLGEPRRKYLLSPESGKILQRSDHHHNIRGWLTNINEIKDNFGDSAIVRLHRLKVTAIHHESEGELVSVISVESKKDIEVRDSQGNLTIMDARRSFGGYKIVFGEEDDPEWKNFSPVQLIDTISFQGGIPILPNGPLPPGLLSILDSLILNVSMDLPSKDAFRSLLKRDFVYDIDRAFGYRDLFAMELSYEQPKLVSGNAFPQYNGNISAMEWRNIHEGESQAYGFSYDGLNRLEFSLYGERNSPEQNEPIGVSSPEDPNFATTYGYDLNGNILSLNRIGLNTNDWFMPIDDLSYSYFGNQLQKVDDQIPNINVALGVAHFEDGSNADEDFIYDENGNMIYDANRGIGVYYNRMNKPVSITKGNKLIRYTYGADGTKLRQKVFHLGSQGILAPSNAPGGGQSPGDSTIIDTSGVPIGDNGSLLLQTDYVNGHHYEDSDGAGTNASLRLDYIKNRMGRIIMNPLSSDYEYHYRLTDHLGNTRVQFREDPDRPGRSQVLSTHDYYPFGMAMQDGRGLAVADASPYLYNGKELQNELGLSWYDYGARMYDPGLGRWNGVDALGENYLNWSPYNYTLNNPVRILILMEDLLGQ